MDLVTTKERDYVAVHAAVEAVTALERRLEVWETEAIAKAAWLCFLQAWRGQHETAWRGQHETAGHLEADSRMTVSAHMIPGGAGLGRTNSASVRRRVPHRTSKSRLEV